MVLVPAPAHLAGLKLVSSGVARRRIDLPVAAAIAGVMKIKVPGYREDMAELDCEKKMWELQRSK